MDFHRRVDIERDIDVLHMMATAQSGDPKFIKKRIEEMQKLV